MVDHDSMREAMNRALSEIHNQYCNNCKNPFIENSGEYTDLVTYHTIYKIWYCQRCIDDQIV